MKAMIRLAAVATSALVALTACGGGDSGSDDPLAGPTQSGAGGGGSVVVGSANFPENVLLGEIYAQALEAKGVTVQKKLNIGAREVIYKSIQSGELSILPEYNGALLAYIDKESKATTTDQVDAELKQKLPSGLELLTPAAAEDKDSVTVSKATADKHKLTTIEDLKPVAKDLVIGGPPEFKTRHQGVLGLKSVYGVEFKSFKSLDVAGPVSVSALKKGDVDAADLFTTDPAISKNGFVTLQDPKNLFSAQNVVPLVNTSKVNDTIKTTLNAVSAKLTTQDLLDMNNKMSTDKEDADAVAKEWLQKAGLGG
ncbi:ABC transporter substrate-binding protein [Actinomadura alba]|uniref:ABC transporter substrate-binding protein n=1 Tax=Actinomadura alba TaxID=406431 RepID=A0ABR7M1T6_9ACTN|nr:ABC transporter substrate-binding protein [Actinomadura alba]MBC6470759.1 ABC transporter substrate-binding protein [Actinomadura alba]